MNDYNKYRDEELIPLLRESKPICDNVFFEIYQRHSKRLNAYCMLRIYDLDNTRDIIQDTWLEFIKSVHKGVYINKIQAYLVSIAGNLINKYLKQHKQKNQMFINKDGVFLDGFSINLNLQQSIENNEMIYNVNLVASSLEEPLREIYILRKINGLTFQEIATLKSENLDYIKRCFSKASLIMHDLLKPYFEEMKS